jgi:hypothetical protein
MFLQPQDCQFLIFSVYQLACNIYPSSTMELWKHQAYIDNMVAQATTTLEVVIR